MEKELLLEMLAQNKTTCSFAFDQVTRENLKYRLNEQTASIGFIYRHIGEMMNRFGLFFGLPTHVTNTTMGQVDTGQAYDLEVSRGLIEHGYRIFENYVKGSEAASWLEPVDTPFFGTVSKVRLFSHVLFHTAHHAGQISLTLRRGK
jgi:uncharacterized damage-inducible protein DinB